MSPFIIFIFLLSVFYNGKGYFTADVKYQCPVEDPTPCNCIDINGSISLECSRLKNRQQLNEAFQKVIGYGITELLIKDSNISHIPRNLFKDSPVSHIRIKNSFMFYLFDRELEHAADTVSEITLDKIDFEGGLDWNVFDNLKALEILSISRSGIESIPYGSSELELPVETLVLEDNYIDNIYEYAFQNFKNLKNLKLNKNFLSRYERKILPLPESGLQFFDLSFNKLTALPEDSFDGMEELHSLLLRGNKFKVLQKSYMQNIYQSLFYLDVSNNPLICDCEMTWLLSNVKPFHVFGECISLQDERKQSLKEITSKEFIQCFKQTET